MAAGRDPDDIPPPPIARIFGSGDDDGWPDLDSAGWYAAAAAFFLTVGAVGTAYVLRK